MNLIAKTTVFYLLVSVLVFGIGGYVTYHVVETEVIKETDFALYDEVQDMADDIRDGIPLEILRRRRASIEHVGDHLQIDTFYRFSDTIAPHPTAKEKPSPTGSWKP